MKTTARLNHSFLFGRNSDPARIATEGGLKKRSRVFFGELDDAIADIESNLRLYNW